MMCVAVDIGYKMVKHDHTCDLVELKLQKIIENLGAIRRKKGAQCKFSAILIFMFLYV